MPIKTLPVIQYLFKFSQLFPKVKYSFLVLYRIQLKTQCHESCCLFKSSNVGQVLSLFCLFMTLAFLKHLGQLSCKTFLYILLINQSFCFRLHLQLTHIHHLLKKLPFIWFLTSAMLLLSISYAPYPCGFLPHFKNIIIIIMPFQECLKECKCMIFSI